jgi:tetratricopeptide (TPR) repeat protein
MRRSLPFLLFSFLLALCCPLTIPSASAQEPLSYSIVPFDKKDGARQAWLDKAIADLVAEQLQRVPGVRLYDRSKLNDMMAEMELQSSGFTDENARSVLRLTQTDRTLFGDYRIESQSITITLRSMKNEDFSLVYQGSVTGDVSQLFPLTKQLVQEYLKKGEGIIHAAEDVVSPASDFTTVEHFYRGLDAYDRGKFSNALAEFMTARQLDAHYAQAQFWTAKMLQELGKPKQAAALYYALYESQPESDIGFDALFFSATLHEVDTPTKALEYYKLLIAHTPIIPHAVQAAYRSGLLLQSQGHIEEAYRAFSEVETIAQRYRDYRSGFQRKDMRSVQNWAKKFGNNLKKLLPKSESGITSSSTEFAELLMRNTRFFDWEDSQRLYREAVKEMVRLYPYLPETSALAPPQGTIIIDPLNPTITSDQVNEKKSLFIGETEYHPDWKEHYYALILPKGYSATGIHMQVTGKTRNPIPTRSFGMRVLPFPLPRDHDSEWLGTIYGQTESFSMLEKNIPFFGKHFSSLALKFIENHSDISRWSATITLVKNEAETPAKTTTIPTQDFAGRTISTITIPAMGSAATHHMPWYKRQLMSRHQLAMADNGKNGIWLAMTSGTPGLEDTNLWITHSDDAGASWAAPQWFEANSLANEWAPQLLRGEDGNLRLFFLSTRRGLGWELWTSLLDRKTQQWSTPQRITTQNMAFTDGIPNYNIIQNMQGEWLLSYYDDAAKQLSILSTRDFITWKISGAYKADEQRQFALGQDGTGRYHLVTIHAGGAITYLYGNDLNRWQVGPALSLPYKSAVPISMYSITILAGPAADTLRLIFSDTTNGLQFVDLNPAHISVIDLVTQARLEPYAIAAMQDGYRTALITGSQVEIKTYPQLTFAKRMNDPTSAIYTEESQDSEGGNWRRIFARARYIMPDVTAVGTGPGERVWWGIETGIMSLLDGNHFVSDVSLGFFSHHIDQITHCGGTTWFAASTLAPARVGYYEGNTPTIATMKKSLSFDSKGAITSTSCAATGTMYFATDKGEIFSFDRNAATPKNLVAELSSAITALAFDATKNTLYIATETGELNSYSNGKITKETMFPSPAHAMLFMRGGLWISLEKKGLHRWVKGTLEQMIPDMPLLSKMQKRDDYTILAMSDMGATSYGLITINGNKWRWLSPPQRTLADIIDFSVTPSGQVWIGSNSDGIYHYTPGGR